ncbi:MAG: hypothetical protein IJ949_04135, partial [Oscillospiraceae bacterium]|nr:hypothetical protein [Oscillospiraceae bacterium]
AVAVAPGTAEIKAIAKIGDETETASVTVTVNDLVLSRANFAAEKYDVHKTEILPLSVNAYLSNDEEVSSEDFEVTYTVDDSTVAKIEGKSGLLGVSNGTTTVRATVKLGNTTLTEVSAAVNVIDDGFSKVELGAVTQVIKAGGEGTDLFVRAFDNNDAEIPVPDDAVVYTSADENVVSVNSSTGRVTPVNEGVTTLTATVTIDGIVHSADIIISVRTGKVKSTFYTEEKVSAARENVKKYDWAKKIAETATKNADKYLASLDHIYNIIPANTIPRAYDMVEAKDPEIWHCIYCGTDLLKRYGKDCWGIDSINRPWKVQCPECKRLFPSNDFDSYYKNGLDEHGEFDYTLARENNGILCGRGERNEKGEYVVFDWAKDNPYGYGDPKGKLYNETYQELWTNPIDPWKKITITQGWGDFRTGDNSGVPSEGYFWGVDDGFGYDTGRKQTNGIRMVYRMAAVFAHEGLWFTNSAGTALIYNSLNAFRDAYLYTGDEKYGRAGAIILDRIADLYPDFDYAIDCPNLQSSHGGSGTGKIVGSIWENKLNRELSKSYDAFFDIYDDPEVIEYLSGYAEKWNLDNKKTNGDLIRQNAEENLLVETFRGVKKATIAGNFGMKQRSLALAAVILDREKDTQEMIDFIMQPGTTSQVICTGGNLMPTIINDVDRDGYGNESSYGYLIGWTANLLEMIEALADYG